MPRQRKTKIITKPDPIEVHTELLVPAKSHPLNDLINDPDRMAQAKEYASIGFSTTSIACKLHIPIPTFHAWIRKGKELSEEDPLAPEAILFSELAESWANARGLAEAALAQTKPEIFLTRGPGKLLGDDWVEQKGVQQTTQETKLDIGNEILEDLRLLRQQGVDLNDIIDNDTLQLKGSAPKPKEVLEEKSTSSKVTSLPGKMRGDALLLETVLDLKYGQGKSNGEE